MSSQEAKTNNVIWHNVPNQDGAGIGGSAIQFGAQVDQTKIYKKLALILKEGISVGKTGWNNFHKYHYVTEADVVEAVRGAFSSHGIIYTYDMLDAVQISAEIVRTKIRFSLIDADSGQSVSSVVYGDGQDKGDKGVFKAITGAQKYFLLKTFLISTGDDPENDSAVPNEPKNVEPKRTFNAPKTQEVSKPVAPAPVAAAPSSKPAPVAAAPQKTLSTAAKPSAPGFNRSAFKSTPTTAPKSTSTSPIAAESSEDTEF